VLKQVRIRPVVAAAIRWTVYGFRAALNRQRIGMLGPAGEAHGLSNAFPASGHRVIT
jgi:hypothetical protein